jgi:ribosomal protein S18 acetylase RimI-like enzyme
MTLLSLFSFLNSSPNAYKVEYKKAHTISAQEWPTLEQLWIEIFADAYKGMPNTAVDNNIVGDAPEAVALWLKKQFADYRQKTFDNDLSRYVLLYDDNKLIGYAVFVLWPDQSLIHVPQIAVIVDCQRKGAGKALMNAVFKYPSTCKSVVLTTRILNTKAQDFYKKLGFYQVYEGIENIPCDFAYSVLLQKEI